MRTSLLLVAAVALALLASAYAVQHSVRADSSVRQSAIEARKEAFE